MKKEDKPFMYINEPLEIVENIKYLSLEVPLNQSGNECGTRPLDAGKRPYYAFEKTCNHREIKVGFSRLPI